MYRHGSSGPERCAVELLPVIVLRPTRRSPVCGYESIWGRWCTSWKVRPVRCSQGSDESTDEMNVVVRCGVVCAACYTTAYDSTSQCCLDFCGVGFVTLSPDCMRVEVDVYENDLIARIARREERWTFRVHDGVRVFALQLRSSASLLGWNASCTQS